MSRRLVIITEIISPYRIPLFNALAKRTDVALHVIFLAETDPGLRQWQVYKDEIQFPYEVLPSWRRNICGHNTLLNRGVGRVLSAARPDVILCGGYNYVASWVALRWARARDIPFFLWSESNLQDLRRGQMLVEFAKREFLARCGGFVVPGRSAFKYLQAHKIREDNIFTAVNAVDNNFFARSARSARENEMGLRKELGLPERYFLFVGRLVKEKGVFELLAAYAKLNTTLREGVGLVFVGDGASRKALEDKSATLHRGSVKFTGFAQRECLADYYALAETLVLPTYTDTWGLVVNEAMACGLPIIVSEAAGCTADLVTEGWNGYIVPRTDVESLSRAMETLTHQPGTSRWMGENSSKRIVEYSPEAWSEGIVRMMREAETKRG